jgi:hypothetical protein
MQRFHLRASAVLLTLSPALYAQAPNPSAGDPPATDAAAPNSVQAPLNASAEAPATAPPTPMPPDAARAQPGPPSAPARRPTRLVGRNRTAQPTGASSPLTMDERASDPSVDLHESTPAPAAPIPSISAWLGLGSLWVPSDGLDPFSKDDALLGFSAGAALSLASAGALASAGTLDIAAVVGFDTSTSDENYRNEGTSLDLTRFALGPELRGSLLDRLYWHGRLSPTLTRLSAELDESSSGATLSDAHWVWGAEAALGLELRFAEATTSLPQALEFFVRVEGGYAWSPTTSLELEAGSGAPVRTASLELAELALAGPLFRANVGLGF